MSKEKKAINAVNGNVYEQVIVAAKLARKINSLRVVARDQLAPEELANLDRRKVTSVALEELKDGKVQYEIHKIEAEEETYDLT